MEYCTLVGRPTTHWSNGRLDLTRLDSTRWPPINGSQLEIHSIRSKWLGRTQIRWATLRCVALGHRRSTHLNRQPSETGRTPASRIHFVLCCAMFVGLTLANSLNELIMLLDLNKQRQWPPRPTNLPTLVSQLANKSNQMSLLANGGGLLAVISSRGPTLV